MAAEPKKNADGEDLSMEEILQSIRKIIADEDTDETPADASAFKGDGPMGSDVLELTDMVEEPPQSVDVLQEIDNALADEKAPDAEQVLEVTEEVIEKTSAPVEIAEEHAAAPAAVTEPAPMTDNNRLISDQAASASAKSFQKVIQTHKATTPMPHFRNGETIEDLVLETLKPLLKEWLDANLPSMVERIVEREIRKIVD